MINDVLLIYFLFNLMIMIINILSYTRMPFLAVVGIIACALLSIPTIVAFGDYYLFAIILILINAWIPIMALARARAS